MRLWNDPVPLAIEDSQGGPRASNVSVSGAAGAAGANDSLHNDVPVGALERKSTSADRWLLAGRRRGDGHLGAALPRHPHGCACAAGGFARRANHTLDVRVEAGEVRDTRGVAHVHQANQGLRQ